MSIFPDWFKNSEEIYGNQSSPSLLTPSYLLFSTPSPGRPPPSLLSGPPTVTSWSEKRDGIVGWGWNERGRLWTVALDIRPPGLALLATYPVAFGRSLPAAWPWFGHQ